MRITLKYALKSFTLLLVGGWRAHVFELLINLQFSLPCFPHGDSAHVGQWSTGQMDTNISANMISFLKDIYALIVRFHKKFMAHIIILMVCANKGY